MFSKGLMQEEEPVQKKKRKKEVFFRVFGCLRAPAEGSSVMKIASCS